MANLYKLPSVVKRNNRRSVQDIHLHQVLETNLDDPSNCWQPKDHSTLFMQGLRRYRGNQAVYDGVSSRFASIENQRRSRESVQSHLRSLSTHDRPSQG